MIESLHDKLARLREAAGGAGEGVICSREQADAYLDLRRVCAENIPKILAALKAQEQEDFYANLYAKKCGELLALQEQATSLPDDLVVSRNILLDFRFPISQHERKVAANAIEALTAREATLIAENARLRDSLGYLVHRVRNENIVIPKGKTHGR